MCAHAQLPFGNGKKTAVAVFARGDKADEARSAGAAIVGAEDLVAAITAGTINFTKCIATPDMMPLVGRVARVRQRLCVATHAPTREPCQLVPHPSDFVQ